MTADSELVDEVLELKREKDVMVMAHNYQVPAVQDIADIVGDSLYLAMMGKEVDAEAVVFCGVAFMAESVKLVNPGMRVIHPVPDSKCPMAGMVDPGLLSRIREENPGAPVVAYVNTTAETKTMVDICCTSANAVKIVRSLPEERIIFVPDQNLGAYVQGQVPEKELVLYPGYCHVHTGITVEVVESLRTGHPGLEILAHPECVPEVVEMADHVLSTEGMIRHAQASEADEFIVLTERELTYRIKTITGKTAYAPDAVCPNMKKIRLEDVARSLRTLEPTVELDEDVISRAGRPLERMLEVGRGVEG